MSSGAAGLDVGDLLVHGRDKEIAERRDLWPMDNAVGLFPEKAPDVLPGIVSRFFPEK
jgi:hypothetical protein